MKRLDIAGQRFGRLVVLSFIQNGKPRWACRCDCGEPTIAFSGDLRAGKVKSCGCLKREQARVNGRKTKGPITHGKSTIPEYSVWKTMIQRCTNPKSDDYYLYGERGIRVCDHWRYFVAFFSDMGERPSSKHSIDRKNNDGDYTPENCRWATAREQVLNRRPRGTTKKGR